VPVREEESAAQQVVERMPGTCFELTWAACES
jgi:hypothetical protein